MIPPRKLVRSCGRGSQNACNIARKMIFLGKLSIQAAGHGVLTFADVDEKDGNPNKMPFTGVLLLVDVASTKPPHGSQGHRIYVPKDVALKKLSGLLGQAINYDSDDLDSHVTRHKVGVITRAWLEGNKVKVSGFIWKKDFPEATKDLRRNDLGMSMELADVWVDDEKADIWRLTDFEFTGATILTKDAAAYYNTSLAAAAVAAAESGEGEKVMRKDKDKKKNAAAARDTGQGNGTIALMAQALGGQLSTSLTAVMAPLVNEFKANNERLAQRIEDGFADLNGNFKIAAAADHQDDDDDEIVLTAAAKDDSSDDDDDDDDMAAAKRRDDDDDDSSDDDDDDDMSAARKSDDDDDDDDDSSDDDDDSSLDAALEDLEKDPADMEPGEMNKNAGNRGSKKTVTTPPRQGEKFPGNVAKGRLPMSAAGKRGKMKQKGAFPGLSASARVSSIEAAAVHIERLTASNQKLRRTVQAQADEFKQTKRQFKNQINTMRASLERFAELEGRRSVMPVELTNLASKVGVNLPELKASGEKLSVAQVDNMFASAKSMGINIEPQQRMAMKMLMEEQGIMDAGVVDRNYGRN